MSRCLASLGLCCAALCAAASAGDVDDALKSARERYPATDVRSAAATPLPGVYEFDMGGETVYGDKSARYLILGKLVDIEELEVRRADYDEAASQAFLLQDGDKGELVLFSDPDCPYCAKLERRLVDGELQGWRIGVILIQTTGGSGLVSERILCASDPGKAYRSYLLDAKEPEPCTGGDVAAHESVAIAAGISATPTFLAPSGAVLAGLPEADRLRSWATAGQRGR